MYLTKQEQMDQDMRNLGPWTYQPLWDSNSVFPANPAEQTGNKNLIMASNAVGNEFSMRAEDHLSLSDGLQNIQGKASPNVTSMSVTTAATISPFQGQGQLPHWAAQQIPANNPMVAACDNFMAQATQVRKDIKDNGQTGVIIGSADKDRFYKAYQAAIRTLHPVLVADSDANTELGWQLHG